MRQRLRTRRPTWWRTAAALVILPIACEGIAPESPPETVARTAAAIALASGADIGTLTSITGGRAATFYEHDGFGRTVRTLSVRDHQIYAAGVSYGYPQQPTLAPGSVTVASTFPSALDPAQPGETVRYAFDGADRLVGMDATVPGQATQSVVANISYNARGQRVHFEYGNRVTTDFIYDEAGDLRLHDTIVAGGGRELSHFVYGYDEDDNITSLRDDANPATSSGYGYDSLNQLDRWNGLAYDYDAAGNLITMEGAAQSYGGEDRGPHALASAAGVSYGYDENGNLSSGSDGLTIEWNAQNLPERESRDAVTISRTYLDGALTDKDELRAGGEVVVHYLPSLRIENGRMRTYYGEFAERGSDGAMVWHSRDHLSGTTLATRLDGSVAYQIAYSPYGRQRTDVPFAPAPVDGAPAYTYNDKEPDGLGLLDYGARLYNPSTGRWLSPDTIADGPNAYAYVSNNPVRFGDPTGNQGEPEGRLASFSTTVYARAPGFFESIGHGILSAASRFAHGLDDWAGSGVECVLGGTHCGRFALGYVFVAAPVASPLAGAALGGFAAGSAAVELATAVAKGDPEAIGAGLLDATLTVGPLAADFVGEWASSSVAEELVSAPRGPTGKNYSVAFETTLKSGDIPTNRGLHARRANAALDAKLQADPEFAQMMGEMIPGVADAVASRGGRKTPADWRWHHDQGVGAMQLVPKEQHRPGSIFWDTLHPGGRGGYAIWAVPAGAKPNR